MDVVWICDRGTMTEQEWNLRRQFAAWVTGIWGLDTTVPGDILKDQESEWV